MPAKVQTGETAPLLVARQAGTALNDILLVSDPAVDVVAGAAEVLHGFGEAPAFVAAGRIGTSDGFTTVVSTDATKITLQILDVDGVDVDAVTVGLWIMASRTL